MKKFAAIALALVLIVSLAACRRGATDNTEPTVTTAPTTTPTTRPTTESTTMPTIDPTINTNIPDPDVDTSMPDITDDFTTGTNDNANEYNRNRMIGAK